ncbi:cell wall-associated NlpC family hydrolase [Sinobaca qinghaiensis]|uniref:Cell wall-associated NlpC family hydrolase n=1 Tax=Sinobaca qinghaiensis TaxID=342944 RepID=A0A419V5G1_9BACL|nr:cell wall-binding repeat-containing protein [Sinobaca qinghaiensis]RKD75188.1 cell wall-associated NlpC family hydrolase [Sinobaca qinghaiensis]
MKKSLLRCTTPVVFACVIGFAAIPSTADASERIHGEDRIGTSIEISEYGWSKSDFAILARADHPADALASASLVAKNDAPILLTKSGSLDTRTISELRRLNTKTVYLLGGTQAISSTVEQKLKAEGISVQRISGETRYETAEAVNKTSSYDKKSSALLVSGQVAADALSASGMAAIKERPIYLTRKDSLSVDLPAGIKHVTIFGGTAAVSAAVEQKLRSEGRTVERIQGDDRYETSIAAARSLSASGSKNIYVRGTSVNSEREDYPDAVAAAGLANKLNSPVILSHHSGARSATIDYAQNSPSSSLILGGTAAISDSVMAAYESASNSDTSTPEPPKEQVGGVHTDVIDNVIATGESYIGTPYLFGAASSNTDAFDCSSFTQRAFAENGITLPRTSRQQFLAGTPVERTELKKGDLVFFDTNKDDRINHVSIYIDEKTLLHATVSKGVDYTSFSNYWNNGYVGAVRMTP